MPSRSGGSPDFELDVERVQIFGGFTSPAAAPWYEIGDTKR
jgi:hypothetical protein